jgi:hypothetical protein
MRFSIIQLHAEGFMSELGSPNSGECLAWRAADQYVNLIFDVPESSKSEKIDLGSSTLCLELSDVVLSWSRS